MKYILQALPSALLLALVYALSRGTSTTQRLSRSERESSLASLHQQIRSLRSSADGLEASRPPALPRGIGR